MEHLPATENVRALRAVLSTLGDGFVEAVDDNTLLAIARNQPAQSNGQIHGEAIEIPILESPGQTRVGRFGWKDQQPTVLSFAADAYLNEMGVTNRLRPTDTTPVCKTTSDPEDVPDGLGLANIDHFAQFIRGTKVPPAIWIWPPLRTRRQATIYSKQPVAPLAMWRRSPRYEPEL